MPIGTRMRSIEWCYFQWPWVTPEGHDIVHRQIIRKWYSTAKFTMAENRIINNQIFSMNFSDSHFKCTPSFYFECPRNSTRQRRSYNRIAYMWFSSTVYRMTLSESKIFNDTSVARPLCDSSAPCQVQFFGHSPSLWAIQKNGEDILCRDVGLLCCKLFVEAFKVVVIFYLCIK